MIRALVATGAVAGLALAPAAGAAAAGPTLLFRIPDPRIVEASGIAVGHRSPGIDYVQNDSGDRNRFFALDARTGATVATVTVPGARNVDWEDIATAPGAAGAPSVWLADIGDNDAVRSEVQLYRVREPRLVRTERDRRLRTAPAEVWRLRYPGGPVDAEGLAVGPDGAAYVVTKSPLGGSTVYRVPGRPDRRRSQTLQSVGDIALLPHGTANPFGPVGELAITGAAFSPDGRLFAVRTYAAAYLWPVRGGDLAAALRGRPTRVTLPRQPQGEGIALPGDGTLVVDSEGERSAVYAVPLPAIGGSSAASTTRTATGSSPPPGPAAGRSGDGLPWVPFAVGGGVAALAAAVWGWRRGKIRACRSPRSTRPSP